MNQGIKVRALKVPEIYILGYSFFLNLAWETIQTPLFVFEQQSSLSGLTGCLLFCSGVDAIMTLIAFGILAFARRDRSWFLKRKAKDKILFVALAVSLAILSEYTAVHYRNLWEYSALMPVISGLDIGLVPIVQWLLLPLIALWLSNRTFATQQKTKT